MRHRWWLVLMVGILWGLSGVWAAAPIDAPNVAQVDLQQTFPCPHEGFGAIPDLQLSVETFGNPVLVLWTINVSSYPQGIIRMRPVIDGQAMTGDQLEHHMGEFLSCCESAILPFARRYPLPAGLRTVGVEMFCLQANIQLTNGWLTVYELPPAKLK
jgi:hypothetical protein